MHEEQIQALKVALAKKHQWSAGAVELGIRQNFRCAYCGLNFLSSIENYDTWQFDHVIPTSKGGPDEITNKVIACKLCNFVKGNFDPRPDSGSDLSPAELKEIALQHVQRGRKEKLAKLHDVLAILKDSGWVDGLHT